PVSRVMSPRAPTATLFPYTTLFRSTDAAFGQCGHDRTWQSQISEGAGVFDGTCRGRVERGLECAGGVGPRRGRRTPTLGVARGSDRKSTRLNSSHVKISYAVFCLKK